MTLDKLIESLQVTRQHSGGDNEVTAYFSNENQGFDAYFVINELHYDIDAGTVVLSLTEEF